MKVTLMSAGKSLALASAASLAIAGFGLPVAAQEADLVTVPEPSNDYAPAKTAWGDPDLRGMWPIDNIASIPMSRPAQFGDRLFLNDEEFKQRQEQAGFFEERYKEEDENDSIGMGHWVESGSGGRRTSLLVYPANGQLPAMTPWAQEQYKAGRSSWVNGQAFDWVDDFDSWDRCVSRGFPASMFPFRYNNGIQVLQGPGYVSINLEMIHDARIVKLLPKSEWANRASHRWPSAVRTWMGQSLGYWEDDNTLVVETTNIKAGDSVAENTAERAASPLNMATMGVPPNNTIPTSEEAVVVEKLHMVGPDSILYEATYSDPKVFTDKWTAQLEWTRNPEYAFFEYACHEGNVQVRNYINSSRAERGLPVSKVGTHSANQEAEAGSE